MSTCASACCEKKEIDGCPPTAPTAPPAQPFTLSVASSSTAAAAEAKSSGSSKASAKAVPVKRGRPLKTGVSVVDDENKATNSLAPAKRGRESSAGRPSKAAEKRQAIVASANTSLELLKSAGKTRPLELEDISRLDESDGGRAGAVRNLLTLFHAGEVGASVTKRETALVELSKRHQPLSEAPREQVRLSSRV